MGVVRGKITMDFASISVKALRDFFFARRLMSFSVDRRRRERHVTDAWIIVGHTVVAGQVEAR